MSTGLEDLAKKLGHKFFSLTLLETALTHRSYGTPNNERLEFLGDSVLGLVITEELYQRHLQIKEGGLSRMRASLVNGEVLAKLAGDLGISKYLRLGVGEKKTGGSHRTSILADAMEAIIGAIYLDGGVEKVRELIIEWYGERVDDLSTMTPEKDPKSRLQEWLQARRLPLPKYKVKSGGEAHAQTFTAMCSVEGLPHQATGVSTNRRSAEQAAAQHYLELLDE